MKFKEYVKGLNKALKENPEMGKYTAIYSRDDEGNGYQEVYYNNGSIGTWDGEGRGEFISQQEVLENPEDYENYDTTPNAVVIN
jgi:DNA-binding protein H-NS